jgi:E3 ubiquitin-protein ligase RBBP6
VRKDKQPADGTVDEETITPEPEVTFPPDLQCVLCKGLLCDAVYLSCCVSSCCDDCIRTLLIESDDQQCPVCHEKGVSPDTLIPCIKLRKEVIKFVSLSHNPSSPQKHASQQPDPVSLTADPQPENQNHDQQPDLTDSANGSHNSPVPKDTPVDDPTPPQTAVPVIESTET